MILLSTFSCGIIPWVGTNIILLNQILQRRAIRVISNSKELQQTSPLFSLNSIFCLFLTYFSSQFALTCCRDTISLSRVFYLTCSANVILNQSHHVNLPLVENTQSKNNVYFVGQYPSIVYRYGLYCTVHIFRWHLKLKICSCAHDRA